MICIRTHPCLPACACLPVPVPACARLPARVPACLGIFEDLQVGQELTGVVVRVMEEPAAPGSVAPKLNTADGGGPLDFQGEVLTRRALQ